MSPREILEESSDLRFNFNNFRFAPNCLVPRKGQSEVVLAFIVSSPENESLSASGPLAVKKLCLDGGDDKAKAFNGFAHEVGLLKRVSHPNIVKLAGFVEAESNGVACLVLPWERNGNLHEFIASAEWEIPECISLIKDVAEGVAYLHTRDPPICHGDLKAANILVNAGYRAMITDFGSARLQESTASNSAAAEPEAGSDDGLESDDDFPDPLKVEFSPTSGTLALTGPAYKLRWVAPEILAEENSSLPSDIWSLGWICWEVMTKNVPFSETQETGSIASRIVTGTLPAIQDDTQTLQVRTLCGLMMDCWNQKPEERPSSLHCQETLHWMPSVEPSPATRGGNREVRSTTLLLKLGEMHCAQNNIEGAIYSYKEALDLARKAQDFKAIGMGLLGISDVFRRLSRTSDAHEHTSEALEIFNRIGDDRGVARCYLGLARLQYMQSRHVEAEQLFSKALEVYTRIQDHAGVVMSLEGLGEVCQAQLRLSEAIKYLYHILETYKVIGNELGQGNTLIQLGNIFRALSRYKEADQLFLQALNVFTRIGSPGGRANALVELANIRSMQSNVSEAESLFLQAVQIYDQVEDKGGETSAWNALGEIYRIQSRYQDAEAAFSRALDNCARIGNEPEKGKAMIGLGKTYRLQSRYAEAQNAFASALEVYRRNGDDMGRANALNGLGEASLGSLKHSEANASFSEALAVSDSLNYELGRGNALLGLGHANRAQEMYPAAEAFFVRALEVYTRIDNVTGKAHSLNEMGRTYVVQNKYSQAEMCLSEAMEYFRQSGQGMPTAGTLISLGQISMALQDTRAAEERWIEARKLFSSIGHTEGEIAAEKFLAQIFQMRNASRGSRFHIILVFTCFGVALAAWSATQREWLYTLWLPFRRISDK